MTPDFHKISEFVPDGQRQSTSLQLTGACSGAPRTGIVTSHELHVPE